MFSCHLCDYQCKQKANLKQHKRNKHNIDIIWYKCDICDYQCKQSSALKKHKQYIHDIDVKWIKCDLCDYQCKENYPLKVHKQNKHGIIFKLPNIVSCDICNYQCESTNLKKHKQYIHNIDIFNWKYKKKYKYEKSKYCFIGEKGSYQRLALAISQDLRFQKSNVLILSDDIVELIAEKMKNIRCNNNNNNNKGILKLFNATIIN